MKFIAGCWRFIWRRQLATSKCLCNSSRQVNNVFDNTRPKRLFRDYEKAVIGRVSRELASALCGLSYLFQSEHHYLCSVGGRGHITPHPSCDTQSRNAPTSEYRIESDGGWHTPRQLYSFTNASLVVTSPTLQFCGIKFM
ncbi:hypothetical protein CDAR_186781 [Caerostris darwini]|uniref:Uncharacterized protein n=1 Tax=Caerostris darwini TaxID=1538125 RepID=A0AAV4PMT1_9ARAC|nr:hypothetical protein CDAR_186781 [Caerostris darwini]